MITPLAGGSASFFSSSGGQLIVDIAGYYTGASTATGSDGLFVPVSPYRLVDTRDPANGGPARPGAQHADHGARRRAGRRPDDRRRRGRRQRDRHEHDGGRVLHVVAERDHETGRVQPERGARRSDGRQPRDHAGDRRRVRLLHADRSRPDRRSHRVVHRRDGRNRTRRSPFRRRFHRPGPRRASRRRRVPHHVVVVSGHADLPVRGDRRRRPGRSTGTGACRSVTR